MGITCGLPDRVESPACQAKSFSRWIWNNNNVFIDLFSLSPQNKILSCFCILCLRILLSKFIVITITESNVPSQQQGHILYKPTSRESFLLFVLLLSYYLFICSFLNSIPYLHAYCTFLEKTTFLFALTLLPTQLWIFLVFQVMPFIA